MAPFPEQEFVYVGDAGIVENNGKSRPLGTDLSVRYQLNDWLFFHTDANYAYAREVNSPEGENYIPLAPRYIASRVLAVNRSSGLNGGIQ